MKSCILTYNVFFYYKLVRLLMTLPLPVKTKLLGSLLLGAVNERRISRCRRIKQTRTEQKLRSRTAMVSTCSARWRETHYREPRSNTIASIGARHASEIDRLRTRQRSCLGAPSSTGSVIVFPFIGVSVFVKRNPSSCARGRRVPVHW